MARLYKAVEWKSAGGSWHVADTSDLAKDSAAWWIPARILGLSLEDYIKLLINEYHATIDGWHPEANEGKSFLAFSWDNNNYSYAHKYLLYINRIARNKNWTIC